MSVRFDALADKYTRVVTGLTGTSVTMCCWVRVVVDTNNYAYWLGADDGSANWWTIGNWDDGLGFHPTTTTSDYPTTLAMTVGTWYFVAMVYDSAGTTDAVYYLPAGGSSLTALGASASMIGITSAETFFIGCDGFGEPLNGEVASVKVWAAALTSTELNLERQYWEPQRTSGLWARYDFESGPQTNDQSGNSRTLTSAGTLTAGASNPSITHTGATDLVVANGAHGHVADNVTVSTPLTLVVADGTHAHSADQPSLTQVHVLAADAALHGHTAEAVTLLAAGTLLAEDTHHFLTSDVVTLGLVYNLTVSSITHTHTADNVATFGQVFTLTVANAIHTHAADNIVFPVGVFPRAVSADRRRLVDQLGSNFMVAGDSGWELCVQLSRGDADQYLADRAAKGFNTILVQLTEIGAFTDNGPANFYGDLPFTGAAYASSLNNAYWLHVDYVIDKAASLGITLFAAPCYVGASPSEGWINTITAVTNAQMQQVGVELGTRYRNRPNLVWVGGGDDGMNATTRPRWDAFFTGVASTGDNHLRTYHGGVGAAGNATANTATWFDVDNVYSYAEADAQMETIAAGNWSVTPTRPSFFVEGRYEYMNGVVPTTRQLLRRQIYAPTLMGSLAGWIWGNDPIWHFNGYTVASAPAAYDTWQEALNSPSTADVVKAVAFWATTTGWPTLAPDLTNTYLTTGKGSGNTVAAAAYSTTLGIVYLPAARTITVDLTKHSGIPTARLRWFDPVAGTYTPIGAFATTSSRTVTHPGTNSGGDQDWLLVVDAPTSVSLTVANTLHGLTSDVPSLATTTTIGPADAFHGHTATAVTLTGAQNLAVADALHGHSAEAVTISVGGISLAVADGIHSHAADAVAITGVHALVVADCVHGHTATNVRLVGPDTFVVFGDERRSLVVLDDYDIPEEVPDVQLINGSLVAKRVTGDTGDTIRVRLGGEEDLSLAVGYVGHVRRFDARHDLAATLIDSAERTVLVACDPWLPTAAPGMWGLEVTVTWSGGVLGDTSITYPSAREDGVSIDVRDELG